MKKARYIVLIGFRHLLVGLLWPSRLLASSPPRLHLVTAVVFDLSVPMLRSQCCPLRSYFLPARKRIVCLLQSLRHALCNLCDSSMCFFSCLVSQNDVVWIGSCAVEVFLLTGRHGH